MRGGLKRAVIICVVSTTCFSVHGKTIGLARGNLINEISILKMVDVRGFLNKKKHFKMAFQNSSFE